MPEVQAQTVGIPAQVVIGAGGVLRLDGVDQVLLVVTMTDFQFREAARPLADVHRQDHLGVDTRNRDLHLPDAMMEGVVTGDLDAEPPPFLPKE